LKNSIYILSFISVFIITNVFSQDISNSREKLLIPTSDTVLLDSMSIIPQSEIIFNGDVVLSHQDYYIDYVRSLLIITNNEVKSQKIKVLYRVFPLSFIKPLEHKKLNDIENNMEGVKNPFLFEYTVNNEDIFYLNNLNKSGSISRGVSFGNNQDLAVNSSLNLQLSGKISKDINILASISDDNIPIQAEGNTQKLQEFDKVFIQLFNDKWKLTAGDFILKRPKSYFMNFNKKAQGGSYEILFQPSIKKKNIFIKPTLNIAVSKGKFSRNKIQGVEGNQGPYRLKGAENETYIIVLSGTEKVYIDGRLLKRGHDLDYVIDYNTAEITFTTNRLISKDSRIVVEFQYSDKNYARSLVHFGNEYRSEKLKLNFNVYSEQDSKNQPLQQDLTEAQKQLLFDVGDSLHLALTPNLSLVDFSDNIVLYKMIDTLGYDSVFVYSTNPDSAKYQLGFSLVGANNGNYNQLQSAANGKVYEWVAPIGGIPQGSYEPVILLVTPKELQMATFGGEYTFSEFSKITWEGAISNNDINTFSSKNHEDNIGYAFKIRASHLKPLKKEGKNLWNIKSGGSYEVVDRYFTPVERYRTVEFQRDWNISNAIFTSNQHVFNAYAGLSKKERGDLTYNIGVLKNEGEFDGLNNSVSALYNFKGFQISGKGSLLKTEGVNNTDFVRHKVVISKNIKWFVLGVSEEKETNRFFLNKTDSLLANSFEFFIWKAFVHNADTTVNKFSISYQQREDKTPLISRFSSLSKAEDVELSLALLKSKNHKFRARLTYRKLAIIEPVLTVLSPEENILSRIEYVAKFLKSAVVSNTYYEIGSGLETKKEFSFIAVQSGQGTHAYVGDLNGNGVKDLSEFEIAVFQDQAEFIKIFTPTSEFIRTFSSQLNQGLFLKPETQWGDKKGIRKFIARFSNRTNYRVARKVSNKENYYNPFITQIEDSSLVTLGLSFLNTLYFNRTNSKYGLDFTYQDNKDKSLLVNGIETRKTLSRAMKSRWNITRVFTIKLLLANGEKSNSSDFFSTRNYELFIYETEPKFSIQPSVKFRASLFFNYKEKTNKVIFGGEQSISRKSGVEFRYNAASKGSVMANFNYINIGFTETTNTSLSYEMLEGLQEGENLTWGLTFQRSISKHMQLNLNYLGRKSENTSAVHSGGVQVRAFF